MHGFVNTSNCCWANATIQCIINVKTIRNAIRLASDSHLRDVFNLYANPLAGALDLTQIRIDFQYNFPLGQKNDAEQFIQSLFNEYPDVKSKCQYKYVTITKCSNRNCKLTERRNVQNNNATFMLYLPENRSCSLKSLIDQNIDCMNIIEGSDCSNCGQQLGQVRLIDEPKEVLIFKLQLGTNVLNEKITDARIQGVPQTNLKIKNKTYVLSGAILSGA